MPTEIRNNVTCNRCMSWTSSRRLHTPSQSSSQHCASRIGYQMYH